MNGAAASAVKNKTPKLAPKRSISVRDVIASALAAVHRASNALTIVPPRVSPVLGTPTTTKQHVRRNNAADPGIPLTTDLDVPPGLAHCRDGLLRVVKRR